MTRYLRSNHASLYLGTLLCTGTTTDSAGNVFTIKAQAADATWGSAAPIDVTVQRWMTDGAVVFTQGYENRELDFQVKISADSSVALAAGETALVKAAVAASTVAWVPPEGDIPAPTTLFDVWTVHLEHQLDIDDELRLTRTYKVTATAKPWTRSEVGVTSTALSTGGTPTTVSVDACTATTGWTGSPNAPTVFSATAIRESAAATGNNPSGVVRALTRTGSVTGMGTTPYLALDARFSGTPLSKMTVTVDGRACTKVATSGTITYWQVPAGVTSFTTLVVTATSVPFNTSSPGITVILDVYDVTRTNTIAGVGSHRMLNQHLDIGGAVKTSGSIQLASPSATVLGTVLAYTCKDTGSGYTPAMRQYRTAGGTVTTDATMVSGSKELAGTTTPPTVTYSVPPGLLQEGTYVAVARLVSGASGTVPETFAVTVKSTEANGTTVRDTISTTATLIGLNQVGWVVIGALSLPGSSRPAESQNSVGVQLIVGPVGVGSAQVFLDELFLLDVTHGAFSLVTGASPGTTFTRLWLDSPDVDATKNRPQIYYGANADRSDAGAVPYTQIMSMGDHDLDPDGAMMFTITDNVDDPVITASFYHRWLTHAGD